MSGLYKFGEFRLDPGRRSLMRGSEPLSLAPKAFDMLLVLIENRSRALTKDELLDKVWPGTFVEEGNLKFNVSVIRKALGEDSWIETLPRLGYRFAGQVEEIDPVPQPVATELIAGQTHDKTEVRLSMQ